MIIINSIKEADQALKKVIVKGDNNDNDVTDMHEALQIDWTKEMETIVKLAKGL